MENYRKKFGTEGEETASSFLDKQGFQIIEQNYRCGGGEIDIIASKKGEIHFVEVKTRSSKSWGSGLESISFSKRLKISRAAQHFILMHDEWKKAPKSFSVLSIVKDENGPVVEFIPNAFEIAGDYYC